MHTYLTVSHNSMFRAFAVPWFSNSALSFQGLLALHFSWLQSTPWYTSITLPVSECLVSSTLSTLLLSPESIREQPHSCPLMSLSGMFPGTLARSNLAGLLILPGLYLINYYQAALLNSCAISKIGDSVISMWCPSLETTKLPSFPDY